MDKSFQIVLNFNSNGIPYSLKERNLKYINCLILNEKRSKLSKQSENSIDSINDVRIAFDHAKPIEDDSIMKYMFKDGKLPVDPIIIIKNDCLHLIEK